MGCIYIILYMIDMIHHSLTVHSQEELQHLLTINLSLNLANARKVFDEGRNIHTIEVIKSTHPEEELFCDYGPNYQLQGVWLVNMIL